MRSFVCALGIALATVPQESVRAQRAVRFGIAGGVSQQTISHPDARSENNSGRRFQGNVAYYSRDTFVGIRMEITSDRFGERREDSMCPRIAGFPCPYTLRRTSMLGLALNTTVDLVDAWASPYLIGGAGAYQVSLRTTQTRSCPLGPDVCQAIARPPSYTSLTEQLGLNAGLGLRFRAARVDLVAEARYHHLFGAREDTRVIPVTLGILF